ncbi:inositol-tetrakisphosphate 1-kinase [Holotrichia oblita]|uniref:Inositol-tetrakisphosphate 1-kinase n=1 Tax=Holotrichia oblita TaxID=644536 RepID=A0ACB9TAC6_HOLOL|nr:inositol-tetrakisphosphate 1-kinase [Holotrichia oblita]
MYSSNRIAYWMSDKKLQKINWKEFEKICMKYNFEIFKLDLNKSLESQGPFNVFLHKLTDIIALENQGDPKSSHIIKAVECYISEHPSIIVIDPIPNVRRLLARYQCYSIIHATGLHKYGIFTPNFCEITSYDKEKTIQQLKDANVRYPFICKPLLGHGSKKAHEMCIIFNEKYLKDCRAPCVAQTFINHNAILYKIFVIGQQFYFVERPSLKNFYESDRKTICFASSDISRANSQSSLSVLDPEDISVQEIKPNPKILQKIAETLRLAFEMDLIGIDVVIENSTGKYGIVDVNAYPGYDGFPNLYDALLQCIISKVNNKNQITDCMISNDNPSNIVLNHLNNT